jgi:hypothetical protein
MPAPQSDAGGPAGHSYGAVLVPASTQSVSTVRGVLTGIRFTGWLAPPSEGWIVVIGEPGDGVVADGQRGIVEVGALLAARVTDAVLAVRVRRDRQLGLVAWAGGEEVARYCSDPSVEPGADKEELSEPVGVEAAEALAELRGRPEAEEELTELLGEELDPDSVSESERLGQVLRLLDLPGWIVAAGELPRSMPRGPKVSELEHLRAGATGFAGRSRDAVVRPLRRRQDAPPLIDDPPTGGGIGYEEWMF